MGLSEAQQGTQQETQYVGSEASWEELWLKPMSDTALTGPWQPVWSYKSNPQFVASSTGPVYVWEEPNYTPGPAFTSTGPLPPGCLIGSVTERASPVTQVA